MPRATMLILMLTLVMLAGTAASQEEMGAVNKRATELYRDGDYEAALPEFRKALEIAEARYGDDSPLLSLELNNLGEVYRVLGRYPQAEEMFKRAITLDEDSRDESDPALATSLNNLALVYRAQKRMDEAEPLYTRSLALLERALGPNHPDVARALNNLAVLYQADGRADEARPLLERALSVAQATLGPTHPTTSLFEKNLASLPAEEASPATIAVRPRPAPAAEPTKLPPPPSAQVAAAPTTRGPSTSAVKAYAVHLGSVRTLPDVAKEWRRLSRKHEELDGLELRPPQSVEVAGKGIFYRVIGGRFAAASTAQALCARLKAQGVPCNVVSL